MSLAATRFNSSSKKSSPPSSSSSSSTYRRQLTPKESYEMEIGPFLFRAIIFIAILATVDQLAPHEKDETDPYNKDKKKGKWVTNNFWLVPIIIFSILFGIDVLVMGYGAYATYYLKPAPTVV